MTAYRYLNQPTTMTTSQVHPSVLADAKVLGLTALNESRLKMGKPRLRSLPALWWLLYGKPFIEQAQAELQSRVEQAEREAGWDASP